MSLNKTQTINSLIKHPEFHDKVLSGLEKSNIGDHTEYGTANFIAKHSEKPEVLDKLKNHESAAVRSTVMRNPNTNDETLVHMAKNPVDSVRAMSYLPASKIEHIAKTATDNREVDSAIANNSKSPQSAVNIIMSRHPSKESADIHRALAEHPNASEDIRDKIFDIHKDNPKIGMHVILAGSRLTSKNLLIKIRDESTEPLASRIAENSLIRYRNHM